MMKCILLFALVLTQNILPRNYRSYEFAEGDQKLRLTGSNIEELDTLLGANSIWLDFDEDNGLSIRYCIGQRYNPVFHCAWGIRPVSRSPFFDERGFEYFPFEMRVASADGSHFVGPVE